MPTSGSPATSTPPSRAIASRLERCTASGSSGHGVRTTPSTRSPARARRLDRQQRVVDRAEARAGDDHERQAEVERVVAHEVAAGERDEQPAGALADDHVGALRGGARAPRRAPRARRSRRRARPRGAGRRRGRSVSGVICSGERRPPVAALSSSWSSGRPGSGSSRPVTTGLTGATSRPVARSAPRRSPRRRRSCRPRCRSR